MSEFSGAQWCNRHLGSQSLEDLVDPFKTSATKFVGALDAAQIERVITATYRPPERAYLMHFACMIAGYNDKVTGKWIQIAPEDADPMDDVDIDWTCGGDLGLARKNALAMKNGYGIVYPAALVSAHTERRAMDLHILVRAGQVIRDAAGKATTFTVDANGLNKDVIRIGESYGCKKLLWDPPHWSNDGH